MTASEVASTKAEQVERRASKAGLKYVNSFEDGFIRQRCGKGFCYRTSSGKPIKSIRHLQRIESLVIPPAWTEVLICRESNGHLQAVGTDEAGRRQYLYHERWHVISSATKFDRMQLFGQALPRIRRRVRKDLNGRKLARNRVLAAVVRLMDRGHLRVGNRSYAEKSGSHGATTLKPEHVDVDQTRIWLDFPGKSGQQHEVELVDAKVVKVIRQCEALDGQYLFQYLDNDRKPHTIDSTHVNDYLLEVSGESITAKDFRTWWGSTIAMRELSLITKEDSHTDRKRKIAASISSAARELGNTKAVCKSSYIHPGLIAAAETGEIIKLTSRLPKKAKPQLTIDETRFLAILPKLDFA